MSSRPGFINGSTPDKPAVQQDGFSAPLGGWQGKEQLESAGMEQRPENPNLFRPNRKAKVEDVQLPASPDAE